ncbi:MAG: hypothetical protein ACK40K_08800 [Raineya sp.]
MPKPEIDFSQFMVDITIKRDAWGIFFKLFLGMYVVVPEKLGIL